MFSRTRVNIEHNSIHGNLREVERNSRTAGHCNVRGERDKERER